MARLKGLLMELCLVWLRKGAGEGKVFEVTEIVQEGDKFVQGNRTTAQFENSESVFSERPRKSGWNGSTVKRQVREVWEAFQTRIEGVRVKAARAEKRANVFEKLVRPVDTHPFL